MNSQLSPFADPCDKKESPVKLDTTVIEWPVFVFLMHQVIAFFIVFWTPWLFKKYLYFPAAIYWTDGFFRWDGLYYLSIAQYNYTSVRSAAFFPLFPWSIAIIHALTGIPHKAIALLVTNISFLAGLIVTYYYALTFSSRRVAEYATLLVAFIPTSVFYGAGYPESLFLFLSVSALYMIRTKQFLRASIITFLCSLCRPQGICLGLAVFPELWRSRNGINNWMGPLSVILASISGIAIYVLFLNFHLHQPLAFIHAQKYWERELVFPGTQLISSLVNIIMYYHYSADEKLMLAINALAGIIAITLILFHFRKEESSSYVYVATYVLITLMTAQHGWGSLSIARHVMVLVPLYLWLVPTLLRSRALHTSVLVGSVALYVMLQIMFSMGYLII